jgi:hypothetical protein
MNRIPAALLWILLIAIGCGLGPPVREDLGAWLIDLLTGRWGQHPPWVVAGFQLMGLWPALVGLLIRADWWGRPPAWPFVLASFVLGCYALLPWFILRQEPRRIAEEGWFARWDVPVLVVFVAIALVVWAGATGSPMDLQRAADSEGFLYAMRVDFLAFWMLSVVEARARTQGTPWAWTLLPLVGLGVFLALEERSRRATPG